MKNAEEANPKGKISFRGKEYSVEITMDVLNLFEAETGIDSLGAMTWRNSSRSTTCLMWCCLILHEDNRELTNLKRDELSKKMSLKEWGEAMKEIYRIIRLSMPIPEEAEEKKESPAPEEAKEEVQKAA